MATATYVVEIDWDNNGTFTGTGEDVTARTLRIEYGRGRDTDSQLTGKSVAGQFSAILNNQSGDYNSFNSASPLYGSLLPGRLVQLRATAPATGTLWRGYLERIIPNPRVKELDTVTVQAIGPLGFLNQKEVSMGMLLNLDTGSIVGTILTEAGWSTAAAFRDIDTGKTSPVRFWVGRQRTLDALRKVEEVESGFLRESGSGKIVFENRHRRETSPYTTSQVTLTDGSGGLVYQEVIQEDPLPFVFNEFVATVKAYTTGTLGTLWKLPQTGTLSPAINPNGGTVTFTAVYPNPTATNNAVGVDSWTTPTATTDWQVFSDQAATGTDLTGSSTIAVTKYGNDMKIVVTNNSNQPGYITLLQARGIPLLESDPVTVSSSDGTSGTRYGTRTFPSKAEAIPNADEARGWGDWNTAIYKDPTVRLQVSFVANVNGTHLTHAIQRDVSDRITFIATGAQSNLGINGDFYIESLKHVIEGNRTHVVTWSLSDAKQFSDGWVLDIGALGTNTRLNY